MTPCAGLADNHCAAGECPDMHASGPPQEENSKQKNQSHTHASTTTHLGFLRVCVWSSLLPFPSLASKIPLGVVRLSLSLSLPGSPLFFSYAFFSLRCVPAALYMCEWRPPPPPTKRGCNLAGATCFGVAPATAPPCLIDMILSQVLFVSPSLGRTLPLSTGLQRLLPHLVHVCARVATCRHECV